MAEEVTFLHGNNIYQNQFEILTVKWLKMGNGHLQDFVHEATQIDIPTNFEQNRCLQTLYSKQIKYKES